MKKSKVTIILIVSAVVACVALIFHTFGLISYPRVDFEMQADSDTGIYISNEYGYFSDDFNKMTICSIVTVCL